MKLPVPPAVAARSTFGCSANALSRFATALCVSLAPVVAHAGLELSCPVQWEMLTELQRGDVDSLLFGVKIRDWKPEFFDEMARKHEVCMAEANTPDSLRVAELEDINSRILATRWMYFDDRDKNIKKQQAAKQTAQTVVAARQQGVEVPMSKDGIPLDIKLRLRYPERGYDPEIYWTCGNTGKAQTGWIDEASIQKAIYYTDVCLQSGRAKQQDALAQKENLELLARLYGDIDKLAKGVSDAVRATNVSAQTMSELRNAYSEISSAASRVAQWPDKNPILKQAGDELKKLSAQAEKAACDAAYGRVKFPDAWRTAAYLEDWNSAMPFTQFICNALSTGAQVRYLSGGLISSTGFEVKSKVRTVQVFVDAKRLPGGDPNALLLSPVSAKINNEKMTITRQNFRAFIAELTTAMMNQ